MPQSNVPARILVVEDEPNLAFSLQFNLKAEGYDVVLVGNGREAFARYKQERPFSLVILDVMLPEIDGFSLAQRIRMMDPAVEILMLTALSSTQDKLDGLKSGVDDYITKPFHLNELLLRIRRMVTRSKLKLTKQPDHRQYSCGPFQLVFDTLKLVTPRGEFVLTVREAEILREFFLRKGQILTREFLLERVWQQKGNFETRTIDNFIMRLRKYLEKDPSDPKVLLSVRGRGYQLNAE